MKKRTNLSRKIRPTEKSFAAVKLLVKAKAGMLFAATPRLPISMVLNAARARVWADAKAAPGEIEKLIIPADKLGLIKDTITVSFCEL